jgi:predicted HTH transcriptional regulator
LSDEYIILLNYGRLFLSNLYLFATTKKKIGELWAEYLKKMNETQTIEYKSSWHDDYLKWVCGFANATGGTIYIGKNDKGEVVGVSEHKKTDG